MLTQLTRSTLWLMFFGGILVAWWIMYSMATGMGLDLLGRPNEMAQRMAAMDPPGTMTMEMPAEDGSAMDGMSMNGETSDEKPMDGMSTDGESSEPMPMDGMQMDMDMDMPMDMNMTSFGPLAIMWAIMMAAMMLPTMVPTLTTYERLMVSADGTRAGWVGVLGGYAIAWVGFAALIAGVQVTLLYSGVIDMLGAFTSKWLAAGLFVVVGAFQFTRAKEICHGVCHSPMTYFLGHWDPSPLGGLKMGLGLGVYCVGCCWGFMALGFVGGVMNLLWMGLATLFMVLEKLPQIGHHLRKPAGVVLILAGFYVALVG